MEIRCGFWIRKWILLTNQLSCVCWNVLGRKDNMELYVIVIGSALKSRLLRYCRNNHAVKCGLKGVQSGILIA